MKIELEPIAYIENAHTKIEDDNWGKVISKITLVDTLFEESFMGLEDFSHVEIIYYFHQVSDTKIVYGARHPRNNSLWPKIGVFAQRGKNRPNRIGLTIAKVMNREGNALTVLGLDAINGTPVLDIKPVFREFLPPEPVRQPAWVDELMENYWTCD